jgi:hypothetical protein
VSYVTARGRQIYNELAERAADYTHVHHNLAILSLIARHAVTHHRLQERQCTYGLTEHEVTRENQLEMRIIKLVSELRFRDPVHVTFRGDPRGFTVRLHVKGHPDNTWGGASEGYGL